jgi:hypothetical protein
MLLCSFLQSQGLTLRIATSIVREKWSTWLPMLAATESHFEPGLIPPVQEQFFLGVAVAVGRHPIVADAMGMDAALTKLAELTSKEGGIWAPPIGVSISACLRQLRANERETGVKLSDRSTRAEIFKDGRARTVEAHSATSPADRRRAISRAATVSRAAVVEAALVPAPRGASAARSFAVC